MLLMKLAFCFGIGFAQVVNTHGEPQEFTAHASGDCVIMPEEGNVCSEYLAGQSVFLWTGKTLEGLSEYWIEQTSTLKRAAQTIATPKCLHDFQVLMCLSWFPPCDADNNPRRICMNKGCMATYDTESCGGAFAIADGAGMGHLIPHCNEMLPDEAANQAGMYYHYHADWKDSEMWVDDATNPTCVGVDFAGGAGACKPEVCPEPYIERRFPILKDPTAGLPEFVNPEDMEYCTESTELDCERCNSNCYLPCPMPVIYDSSEYDAMWYFNWVPGVVAFPLNLMVLFSEYKKLQGMKRKDFTDHLILISSCLSILLFFMDALPSLIQKEDLRCNGKPTYSWLEDYDGHRFCYFGKLKVHVLQSLLFVVVCTLYKVRKQLKASLSMARYQPSWLTKASFVFGIFVVPSILATVTIALDSDQLWEQSASYRISLGEYEMTSLQIPNRIRYAFTCGPRYRSATLEAIFVQAPMLLAGLMQVVLSVGLMKIVLEMHMKQSTGAEAPAMDKAARKAKRNRTKNKTLRKLAINMIRFAVLSVFLVVVNAVATALFLPAADKFAINLTNWQSCSVSGFDWANAVKDEEGNVIGVRKQDGTLDTSMKFNEDKSLEANMKFCGDLTELAPPLAMLQLISISNGLPSLCFALIFALPALKQLKDQAKKGLSKISPSAFSTNSSVGSSTD